MTGGLKNAMLGTDATPSDFNQVNPKFRNTNLAMLGSSMTKNDQESRRSVEKDKEKLDM